MHRSHSKSDLIFGSLKSLKIIQFQDLQILEMPWIVSSAIVFIIPSKICLRFDFVWTLHQQDHKKTVVS